MSKQIAFHSKARKEIKLGLDALAKRREGDHGPRGSVRRLREKLGRTWGDQGRGDGC